MIDKWLVSVPRFVTSFVISTLCLYYLLFGNWRILNKDHSFCLWKISFVCVFILLSKYETSLFLPRWSVSQSLSERFLHNRFSSGFLTLRWSTSFSCHTCLSTLLVSCPFLSPGKCLTGFRPHWCRTLTPPYQDCTTSSPSLWV